MAETTPGDKLTSAQMPGHWLLARLGKRVLRPGGLGLTQRMLSALDIQPRDHVVEFAPGLGVTAKLALRRRPASYTALERDETAAGIVRRFLSGPDQQCVVGRAEESGLEDERYDVAYGEAMLSMQTPERKVRIIREAFRILKPAARYGLHELCLTPDTIPESTRAEIERQLAHALHHGARLPSVSGWRELLSSQGFVVRDQAGAPMHLLEPQRLIADEGVWGALRFGWNLLKDKDARQRVAAMRQVFKRYAANLGAIMLLAVKPGERDR